MAELKRANKVTAYWSGDGIAMGIFYKTHEKITSVKSSDDAVTGAGFKMPEGEDVTAAQKLEAYKTFLSTNATVFGVAFDPVDRRVDEFKFPGHYTEDTFKQFSKKILEGTIAPLLKNMQDSYVTKQIAAGKMPATSAVQYGISDEPAITVTEKYSNGNIKYASAKYAVAFAVNGVQTNINANVDIVSGQLKKPRTLGDNNDVVITMTGIKNLFVEKELLPKPAPTPKAEKAEKSEDGAENENCTDGSQA